MNVESSQMSKCTIWLKDIGNSDSIVSQLRYCETAGCRYEKLGQYFTHHRPPDITTPLLIFKVPSFHYPIQIGINKPQAKTTLTPAPFLSSLGFPSGSWFGDRCWRAWRHPLIFRDDIKIAFGVRFVCIFVWCDDDWICILVLWLLVLVCIGLFSGWRWSSFLTISY